MTTIDWTPMLQAVIGLCAMVITAVTAKYLPRAIKAYEQISGIQLDAAQQASIYHAADTAAHILISQVEQGLLPLSAATDPNHPDVAGHSAAAIARVPTAAREQNTTPLAMRAIVAGKVADAKPVAGAVPVQEPPVIPDDQPQVVGGRPFGGTGVAPPTDFIPPKKGYLS